MAARTNKPFHAEKTKGLIRASQLLNRLILCAKGKVHMTSEQITAARIVIRTYIPELSAVQHTGEINHNYIARVPTVAQNSDEWTQQHRPTIQ